MGIGMGMGMGCWVEMRIGIERCNWIWRVGGRVNGRVRGALCAELA